MSMSYTPRPLSPSTSQPTRRDRMASALRTLMTEDDIDPEILRAGTQWMTALDIETTRTAISQTQPSSALIDPPLDGSAMPIDPALCNECPFPLESDTSAANPVQSWLGDVFSHPSPPTTLDTDPMGCNPTLLDFAWVSNEWDALLNPAETDHSNSFGTSGLHNPIAPTPQTSTPALPSVTQTPMPPPSQLPFAADRRSLEKSSRPRPSKHQRAHYIIEKRYRAGLHERFEALRDCVESWKHQQQQEEQGQQQQSNYPLSPGTTADGTNEGANRGVTRLNKSKVLCEAVAYIKLLQEENEVVMEHMKLLIRRFRATKHALQQG
ncbi:Basic-region helix-loop-helix (bHLH) transcription factor [Penicillium ucsense]|uniref:Basic-region helix-loop-helix (BHLH) transcription factor n=1 Tax=Penicillium ucsense TaxID=2839758 RepID=A0A8J8VVW0_9EURO|nr:Basic-region helix-loop-helix (bHLH) transcription factor [Penicillium ucsense]KAF7729383.1 Basic-region helix-loop-helix (bHLH) transcription factor [Penicillium ucsense]